MTKISSKTIVPATDNQKIPVSPDNVISPATIKQYLLDAFVFLNSSTYDPQSFTDACLFGFQEIAVEDAQYMVDHNIVWNLRDQPIKIVNGTTVLPTGINHVLTKIIFNPSNQYRFDNVCQAWVTALGRYVPCTYDVANNKMSAKFILWAGLLSQSGTDAPTVDATYINILGVTPTFRYEEAGIYYLTATGKFSGMRSFQNNTITADRFIFRILIDSDNEYVLVTFNQLSNSDNNLLASDYIEFIGIISNY